MKKLKILGLVVLVFTAVAGVLGYQYYQDIYSSNVQLSEESTYLYIPSNSNYESLLVQLDTCSWLLNKSSFDWVAHRKNYPNLLKAGRYRIENGMSNNALIDRLRSGEQEAVNLTFNNVRTLHQLAGKLAHKIEADSVQIDRILQQDSTAHRYGFQPEQLPAMFIPNTYQVYWNTTPKQLLDRMAKEFKSFWTPERKHAAAELGLSQSEVATLASIVEEEASKNDEKPRIAGVYLNRLERGMLLQADPTVKFAVGDFTIRRVLNKHKTVDSPYNTYKYTGLPPGPIRIPEISSLKAVLNAESHRYLYFCARDDFSGYHDFARTYNEHLKNARRYQAALNRRGIYK